MKTKYFILGCDNCHATISLRERDQNEIPAMFNQRVNCCKAPFYRWDIDKDYHIVTCVYLEDDFDAPEAKKRTGSNLFWRISMPKETSADEQALIETLVEAQLRKSTVGPLPKDDGKLYDIILTRDQIEKIVDEKIQHLLADMTDEDLDKLMLEVRSRRANNESKSEEKS